MHRPLYSLKGVIKILSVVIPTLGNRPIIATLESLYGGSVVPTETIVVTPPTYGGSIDEVVKSFASARIEISNQKGQVSQRIHGFKRCKYPCVMQLDDDMVLDFDCVKNLLAILIELKKTGRCAVGPMLYDILSGSPLAKKRRRGLFFRASHYLLTGHWHYKAGVITKAGFGTRPLEDVFNISNCPKTLETEWLPGGCVLYSKDDLVLWNYFGGDGKAYCEDLIQSAILKRQGVKFFWVTSAKVRTDLSDAGEIPNFFSYLKVLRSDLNNRLKLKRYVSLSTFSILYLYFLKLIRYFIAK